MPSNASLFIYLLVVNSTHLHLFSCAPVPNAVEMNKHIYIVYIHTTVWSHLWRRNNRTGPHLLQLSFTLDGGPLWRLSSVYFFLFFAFFCHLLRFSGFGCRFSYSCDFLVSRPAPARLSSVMHCRRLLHSELFKFPSRLRTLLHKFPPARTGFMSFLGTVLALP